MKAYAALTFLILSTVSYSQELVLGNFKQQNNSLSWQKVYNVDMTIKEMLDKVKSLPVVDEIISVSENSITIRSKKITHDYRATGGTEMNTSTYVSRKSSLGNVAFQFKEGRYRVTFTGIMLEQIYTDRVTSGMWTIGSEIGEQVPLQDFAIKANRPTWRSRFKNIDYKTFEYSYSNAFDISKTSDLLDTDF